MTNGERPFGSRLDGAEDEARLSIEEPGFLESLTNAFDFCSKIMLP